MIRIRFRIRIRIRVRIRIIIGIEIRIRFEMTRTMTMTLTMKKDTVVLEDLPWPLDYGWFVYRCCLINQPAGTELNLVFLVKRCL